jgi:hypothetical protein
MGSKGIMLIASFVKTGQVVQTLRWTYTHHSDLKSVLSSFLMKKSKLKCIGP